MAAVTGDFMTVMRAHASGEPSGLGRRWSGRRRRVRQDRDARDHDGGGLQRVAIVTGAITRVIARAAALSVVATAAVTRAITRTAAISVRATAAITTAAAITVIATAAVGRLAGWSGPHRRGRRDRWIFFFFSRLLSVRSALPADAYPPSLVGVLRLARARWPQRHTRSMPPVFHSTTTASPVSRPNAPR